MGYLACLAAGILLGAAGWFFFTRHKARKQRRTVVFELLRDHFQSTPINEITISERKYPYRVRADLARAIERLYGPNMEVVHFSALRREYSHDESVSLTDCVIASDHPVLAVPPEYEEIQIGEPEPVRVLKTGIWLLEQNGLRLAALLAPSGFYGRVTGVQFQIGAPNTAAGKTAAQDLFKRLEEAILRADSYRGKILSLEDEGNSYTGKSTGITVHKLRVVERDQVILPDATLRLLDRNVIQFVGHRRRLAEYAQATKKGILFYGPPGTGKTHTIHYLARALPDHTTLLISAEQVAILDEYMTLARLLQPSIVVLEDVDLIARDRGSMNSPCEEVLLNKLLNEMDGLKEEADILFILTTNRPEALEAALASRPGRVDQAIEFPLPDAVGRKKLVALYSQGLGLADEVVEEIVRRTAGVSAAFIKELMRRSVQFHLESNGSREIGRHDIDAALNEMLFTGGSLNLKLLGATGASGA